MSFQYSKSVGRLRLLHLREHCEAVEEEMVEERARFARLAKSESAPRIVSSFNLFQTPEPLAERLASLCQLPPGSRVLEPSAGLGRLYRAIRKRSATCPVTLVDSSPDCCRELYGATETDPNAWLVQGDFLAQTPAKLGTFESILMNPPFKMGTDAVHILHALKFLAPGGVLVALCADGPRQNSKIRPIATTWEPLPPGSFKSEGTNINTVLLTIHATA
jgi:hypothetical protein